MIIHVFVNVQNVGLLRKVVRAYNSSGFRVLVLFLTNGEVY